MKREMILVLGACSGFGKNLIKALEGKHGLTQVIAADWPTGSPGYGRYDRIESVDSDKLKDLVTNFKFTQIYFISALQLGVKDNQLETSWKLNVGALISMLEIMRESSVEKIFWPSSISIFGPGSRKGRCTQHASFEPNTINGISKLSGEYWGNFYFDKYAVDIRSIRFPEIIDDNLSPSDELGGYVPAIFKSAMVNQPYSCFLDEDTCLPMIYMPDAVRAAIELMDVPKEQITVRTSYNISAMSFSPCDLVASIRSYIPNFTVTYLPDHRQVTADNLPAMVADEQAKKDWGWKNTYSMKNMVEEVMSKLRTDKGTKENNATGFLNDYPDFPMDNYVFTRFH